MSYWSQELDGALFFILKAKHCTPALTIWELEMQYMDLLNSKGTDHHSVWLKWARSAAYEMKTVGGIAPVIRGVTDFMFLCFLMKIFQNSVKTECRAQMQTAEQDWCGHFELGGRSGNIDWGVKGTCLHHWDGICLEGLLKLKVYHKSWVKGRDLVSHDGLNALWKMFALEVFSTYDKS